MFKFKLKSNRKPRAKKSHVMEQIFLSPVKNTKNNQRIRENRFYGVRVLVIYNLAYAVLENTLKNKFRTRQWKCNSVWYESSLWYVDLGFQFYKWSPNFKGSKHWGRKCYSRNVSWARNYIYMFLLS